MTGMQKRGSLAWLGLVLATSFLATASPVHAAAPECQETVDTSGIDARVWQAQAKIDALQAKWAAGDYTGPDRFSGTTTTNRLAEEAIKAKKAEISQFVADWDNQVASTGTTTTTGKSLKDQMSRMAQAGYNDRVADLQRAYSGWEQNVFKKLEGKEDELNRLYEVAMAVQNRYDKEIAALEQEIAYQQDLVRREVACERPPVRSRPEPVARPEPRSQQPDDGVPRVKSLDDQISDCFGRGSEAATDLCLANLVLIHVDPRPCTSSPQGRCAALVGQELMRDCAQNHQGAAVLVCESLAAEWMGMSGVCETASDRPACILAVAAKTGNPYAILDAVEETAERDRLFAILATTTGSMDSIDHIVDTRVHDGALIMSAYAVASRRNAPLDETYCYRLIGGYDGEYGVEDAEVNSVVCSLAVELANMLLTHESALVNALSNERLALEFESLVKRLEAGDVTPEQLMEELRAD